MYFVTEMSEEPRPLHIAIAAYSDNGRRGRHEPIDGVKNEKKWTGKDGKCNVRDSASTVFDHLPRTTWSLPTANSPLRPLRPLQPLQRWRVGGYRLGRPSWSGWRVGGIGRPPTACPYHTLPPACPNPGGDARWRRRLTHYALETRQLMRSRPRGWRPFARVCCARTGDAASSSSAAAWVCKEKGGRKKGQRRCCAETNCKQL